MLGSYQWNQDFRDMFLLLLSALAICAMLLVRRPKK